MSYEYDDQLIDATAVRRRRVVGALLHGRLRTQRQWNDRLGLLVASVFVAVLVCAGCVGVSFVTDLLSRDTTVSGARR